MKAESNLLSGSLPFLGCSKRGGKGKALLSKKVLGMMKDASQFSEGAWLRPHIAAKWQPINEVLSATEMA